jgi:hypothetical protein
MSYFFKCWAMAEAVSLDTKISDWSIVPALEDILMRYYYYYFLSGTSFNMLFTYSLQVVEPHGLKPSQCYYFYLY